MGLNYKQIAVTVGQQEGTIKNLFSAATEIDADPENLEILKKSRGVTLQDFQEIKPIKDGKVKKELIKKRANKQITRAQLRQEVKTHTGKAKPAGSAKLKIDQGKRLITITLSDKAAVKSVGSDIKLLLKKHNIIIKD